MMLKTLPILCLLAVSHCIPLKDTDSSIILQQIFGSVPITAKSVTAPATNEKCTTPRGKDGECVPYYLCANPPEEHETASYLHHPKDTCLEFIDICCVMNKPLPEPTRAVTKDRDSETEGSLDTKRYPRQGNSMVELPNDMIINYGQRIPDNLPPPDSSEME